MKIGSLVRFREWSNKLSGECYVVLGKYDDCKTEMIVYSPKHMIRTKLLTSRLEEVLL